MRILKYLKSLILLSLIINFYSCRYNNQPTSENITNDSLVYRIEQKIKEKKRVQAYKEKQLSKHFFKKTEEYLPIIRKYSKRYGLDWRLIIAQILKESRFKENAVSNKGAKGLMQIMPFTAGEITRELDYEFILRDPRENITAGIYHLYKQLGYFSEADYENRLKLALASYNCGPGRVFNAQDIAGFMSGKRNNWNGVKVGLSKLTSKDWKFHLEVWELGVPPNGYFYGYNETIDYVDDIFKTYKFLRKLY